MGCGGSKANSPDSAKNVDDTLNLMQDFVDKLEDNLTNETNKKWELKKKWEVRTDQGWMPWAPGVDFSDCTTERLMYKMGQVAYSVVFKNQYEGYQINMDTAKWRKIRSEDWDEEKSGWKDKPKGLKWDTGFLSYEQIQLLKTGAGALELAVAGPDGILMDEVAKGVTALGDAEVLEVIAKPFTGLIGEVINLVI